MKSLAGAVTALVISAGSAAATPIYTDGLLPESDHQTIQELRDIRRQEDAYRTEKALHEAGMIAAAIIPVAAISAAFLWWRRSRRLHSDRLVAGMGQAATDGRSQ